TVVAIAGRLRGGATAAASAQLAVALLVLLAGTAGAGLVATDLGFATGDGAQARRLHRHLRLGLFRSADAGVCGVLHLQRRVLLRGTLLRFQLRDFLVAADAHARDQRDHLALDVVEHVREQLEGFALELLLGLLLRVTAQVDALAQVVHAGQMLLPLLVEDAEHHVLFQLAHDLAADHRFLFAEVAFNRFLHAAFDAGGIQLFAAFQPAAGGDVYAEVRSQLAFQGRQLPGLVERFRRDMGLDVLGDHVFADVVDGFLHRFGFHQLGALLIDDLALVVGVVVVVQQVLADVEVVRLDLALRLLDLPADHAVLQRLVFLHAGELHQLGHPFGGEDAHQRVFQRQVEAAGARVALATGAAAQLVVDAS